MSPYKYVRTYDGKFKVWFSDYIKHHILLNKEKNIEQQCLAPELAYNILTIDNNISD